jgi:hypothetical protein
MAGHFGHHGVDLGLRRSPPGLELPDLAAQGVAPVLQFFGAGLDRLALGFEGGETGDVQKGLG